MAEAAQEHHVIRLRTYLAVFFALLVLTAITVAVAQIDFGPWNVVVALMIAGTKAILVASIFMHLYYDNKLYFVIFATAIAFLAIFIIFTMFDTVRRDAIYEEKARPIKQDAVIYEKPAERTPATADTAAAAADTAAGADDAAAAEGH
jgi:cytochrome c oxidase subunit 4